MASKDLSQAGALLGPLLLRLAEEAEGPAALAPLWSKAVGPQLSRHTRPLGLRGGTLLVAVSAPVWLRPLEEEREAVLQRLGELTGSRRIQALDLRLEVPGR